MAESIDNIAEAVRQSGGEPSPECHKSAIKVIVDDNDLSDNEQMKIFKAIHHDVAYADSILAIQEKARHTCYIQCELADL